MKPRCRFRSGKAVHIAVTESDHQLWHQTNRLESEISRISSLADARRAVARNNKSWAMGRMERPTWMRNMAYVAHDALRELRRMMLMASQTGTEIVQSLSDPVLMASLATHRPASSASADLENWPKKAQFGLTATLVQNRLVSMSEEVVWQRPFCRLIQFRRLPPDTTRHLPKLLVVAPLSGNFATLLRDLVRTFLPDYDLFITDWADARTVPMAFGSFSLDHYIDYIIDLCRHLKTLGGVRPLHVIGVCQSTVPLVAAMARLESEEDPCAPVSMTLMCGPIDSRSHHTRLYHRIQDLGWFCNDPIRTVSKRHAGVGRKVYPAYLQYLNALWVTPERSLGARIDIVRHALEGGEPALMDLDAAYFLEMMDVVFARHALPRNEMTHRGSAIALASIRRIGLMTVEGGEDDICGIGQTFAAHDLCCNIPNDIKLHHHQSDVGHYGVFSGHRFRSEIAPRIRGFHDRFAATAR